MQWGEKYFFRWTGTEYLQGVQRMQQKIAWMNVLKGIPPQLLGGLTFKTRHRGGGSARRSNRTFRLAQLAPLSGHSNRLGVPIQRRGWLHYLEYEH